MREDEELRLMDMADERRRNFNPWVTEGGGRAFGEKLKLKIYRRRPQSKEAA